MLICSAGLSSTMSSRLRRGAGEIGDAPDGRLQSLGCRGLADKRERAPGQPMLPVLVEGHDLHRYMAGLGIALQLAEDRPSEHVGQEDVEGHGGRV